MTANSGKQRIFEIIHIGNRSDKVSRAFDYMIMTMIIANITAMFLDTFDSMRPYHGILDFVEAFTVCIFIIEYALRLWTARCLFPEQSAGKAALSFVRSFDGIVDLMTILPFYVLMCLSTVYIYAHYAIDALAGLITGVLAYFVLLRLYPNKK